MKTSRSQLKSLRRLAILLGLLTAPVFARDAFVLLSGGGTPLSNNYSQYLQAQAMSHFLLSTYPRDSVWIFFGCGNRDGEPAQIADVRREVKTDGLVVESWLPGPLPQNHPAAKAVFLAALRNEILPAVRNGGTLFLFVGDHGSLSTTEPKESIITLWQLKHGGSQRGWRTDEAETLSVSELRAALAAGLGKGRVVFCMTQCHSGGFHFLGAPRAVQPNLAWFDSAIPDWAAPKKIEPVLAVAGFTAVDENSIAAGCDPDPDPDRWSGYERLLPEALLGIDLFTGERVQPGLPSFAAAHAAAVGVDQTIDKPRSTSDQFLEHWASLIERLGGEPHLTASVRQAVRAYQRAVDTGLAQAADPDFQAQRVEDDKFNLLMAGQNSGAANLLLHGRRVELEQAIARGGSWPGYPGGDGSRMQESAAWKITVRPAWKAAIEAGSVEGLDGPALVFEKYLLAEEDHGRDLMFSQNGKNPMLNELYWQSGYVFPATLDPAKAEAVTRWGAERRARIAEWARQSPDQKIRAAAGLMARHRGRNADADAVRRTLRPNIAADRALFYRRTLAAWAFLLQVDEKPALAELGQLIALEQTPLPAIAGPR